MSDQGLSPQARGISTLLDSLNPQKGDLSYRMEGSLQVVSLMVSQFTDRDRGHIAEAIVRACETFGQYDKKNELSTNRYALQTLQDLTM
jgi:hypothetical protein